MESWFSNRGYADSMINVKMKKVRFDGNKKMNEISNKGAPLVVIYHSMLNSFGKVS